MKAITVGNRVRMRETIIEHPNDCLPEQLLCNKGEVLIVRKVTGKNAIWPVYVSHEHIADRSFGVTLDEIELEDDE